MTRYIPGRGYGSETTVAGASADAYASVVDLRMKGVESAVFTIENTHVSNGITVKATEEYAGYAAAEANAITGFPANITAGNKGLIEIEKARARIILSIKNQTPGSNASYSVVRTVNRL